MKLRIIHVPMISDITNDVFGVKYPQSHLDVQDVTFMATIWIRVLGETTEVTCLITQNDKVQRGC